MRLRLPVVLALAACLLAVLATGAVAGDPGEHVVNVTDGEGSVDSSYRYDASSGTVEVSNDGGSSWTQYSLSNPDESAVVIQWAVDNSTATYDTIAIGPGTYNGSVTVPEEGRTILGTQGPSQTELTPHSSEPTGIAVEAAHVSIANLTIRGYDDPHDDGILVNGTNVSVERSNFTDVAYGVTLRFGARNSTVADNSFNTPDRGIYGRYANELRIENNTILYALGRGIYVRGLDRAHVRNNTVRYPVGDGIRVDDDSEGTSVANNTVEGSLENGIHIEGDNFQTAHNTTLRDNVVVANDGNGILVGENRTTIVGNNASKNGYDGINVSGSRTVVTDNTAIDNRYGVHVEGDANEFRRNVLTDNGGYAGLWYLGDANVVTNNSLVRNGVGILGDGDYNRHRGNNASENTAEGVRFEGSHSTFTNTTVRGNQFEGMVVQDPGMNVTLEGVTVSDNFEAGILLRADDSTIANSTVSGNGDSGVVIDGASTATLNATETSDNDMAGVAISRSTDVSLTTITAHDNGDFGLYLNQSTSDVTIEDADVRNSTTGIVLAASSQEIDVVDSTVSNNTETGIDGSDTSNLSVRDSRLENNGRDGLFGTDGTTVRNVTASGNGNFGAQVGENSTIRNVTANRNRYGLFARNGSTIRDLVANDNTDLGFDLRGSAIDAEDLTSVDNGDDVRVSSSSITPITVRNVSIGTSRFDRLTGSYIEIAAADGVAYQPPSGYEAVGGAFNATTFGSANGSIDYGAHDPGGIDESSLQLDRYNESASRWETVSNATIDRGANTVALNLSTDGTYRLHAEPAQTGGSGGGGGGYGLPPSSDPSPSFSITSIDLATTEVVVGETVAVDVRIDNDGDADGEYTATLTADGRQVDSETLSINSNWYETATLSTSFDEPGTYQLAVDGEPVDSVEVTGDAAFSTSDVSLQPDTVEAGETVTVSATVTNDGTAEGTMTVPLIVNGQQVDSQSVTLAPGESQTVTFEYTFEEPGEGSVTIGDQSAGSVQVNDDAGAESDGGSGGIGTTIVALFALGIVVAGGAGAYVIYPEKVAAILEQVRTKVDGLLN